jgi:uncharacterized protein (TIGR00369 family)
MHDAHKHLLWKEPIRERLDERLPKEFDRFSFVYLSVLRGLMFLTLMPKKSVHGHDTRDIRLQKNYCFACGKNNPEGMHLKFTYDEEHNRFVCRFRLGKRYTGPPGHAHGGIIATLLDEAMGKVNKLRNVVALTSQITVDYLKPVPLNQPLRVESREVRVLGRRHINMAEILNLKDEVLARSRGLFIAIDPQKMFAKFVER